MLTRTVISRFGLILLGAAAVLPAAGRQPNDDGNSRSSRWSALLNVDLMVNTYSRFLARKYDLDEEQDEFTRKYLRDQANEFMNAHRDEVSDLVDRMFDVRTGGDMDQDELIDWGKRIMPIYQEAKKIIVMGNGEWRDILTDDQRVIHDGDLKLMQQSFETTEDQLHRIVMGEMTVDEFRKPNAGRRGTRSRPQPRVTNRAKPVEPDRPRDFEQPENVQRLEDWKEREVADRGRPSRDINRGDPGERELIDEEHADNLERLRDADRAARRDRAQPAESPSGRKPKPRTPTRSTRTKSTAKSGGKNFESTWEAYTRKFIEKYKLNDEQTQKANSILKDCQDQGRRHLTKNKSRSVDIEKKIAGLKSADKKERAAKMLDLVDRQKKLREPIDKIFEKQLKPRLEKLPTRAQRKEGEKGSSRSKKRSSKK